MITYEYIYTNFTILLQLQFCSAYSFSEKLFNAVILINYFQSVNYYILNDLPCCRTIWIFFSSIFVSGYSLGPDSHDKCDSYFNNFVAVGLHMMSLFC
jgi:hypothetical protein